MLRMNGNKVELYRFKVQWTNELNKTIEKHEYCVFEEQRKAIEQSLTEQELSFTTTALDQTENEWINGLYFETREAALKALNAGQQAYQQQQAAKELTDILKLRSDIDYLAIMSGVEIV